MSTASILPANARGRRFPSLRRLGAWLASRAGDPKASLWLVIGFATVHAVLWTLILVNLKTGQDVHMDVAEAYAWGQKFLLGYGKHPPLSGWVAGVWFMIFPVKDWATYALAMTTLGCGLVICWLLALRVVDRRRAFLVLVMLALYPIFNFKGFKYNPDILQLVTLPLLMLAYLDAFEKRSVKSGIWLGLAGALALMTKYWVLTMIGAIGLAALIHPARLQFLRSPAPWVAIATLAVAMFPHFLWLKQVNFIALTYAGDSYTITDRAQIHDLALGYIGHNLALVAVPAVLAAMALAWPPRRWRLFPFWSRGPNSGVNVSQALNVWIVQAIVAIGPPLGAVIFHIYIKTDWGIPLFFLVPLALVAIPAVRVRQIALSNLAATWLVISLVVLVASPKIVAYELDQKRNEGATYRARSELARELTDVWQTRFHSRWPVVAAYTDTGEPITFYSPDHPAPLTPDEPWSSGLTSLEEAKRSGFIGVCETGDWKLEKCEAWMKLHAANGERMGVTTRRFTLGIASAATAWNVVVVPPAK
ncbi:glycosyltransferase family 39 protein [Bradyrhizobium lablabi]|uniref:glycosyltransferase family 39 protein n=1 Tax=Bradyrhizobium lablabi TaxID=722472 RepID=UPI00090B2503|nr:glycosyltransferase family 39 protein [Bradyrhizobium lablabi]SHL12328.1 Dolichyl-phosphate-mannose-protein mannosyltransferase [Bradyrhizobium lablabi]